MEGFVMKYLFFFLGWDEGGNSSLQLGLEVGQFRRQGKNGIVYLSLIVSIDTWESEEGDPGKYDESEAIGDSSDVGEEIHDHSKLNGLDDVLNE